MSNTFPPDGSHEPEFLEQGGGAPITATPAPGGGGRKKAFLAGGAVVALALVGGGAWAAFSFFGTGAQPAQALPASTIGYAGIDLDPSGGQKIEAVKMLREFPAFEKEIGLDTDDDIRQKLFEELKLGEQCEGLDYGDDIEPWLGDRAAVAAVDTGDEQPTVALVIQVKDEAKAEDGLSTLRECERGGEESGGWAINGDWAILAETEAIAENLADEAAIGSLADDEDYQKWTDDVGDAGIVNLYAAPEAGAYLAENLGGFAMPFGATGEDSAEPSDALKDFRGMAAALRFDDGALELELVGDAELSQLNLFATEAGDDVLSTLPEDTAAAVGVGFADDWFSGLVEQMASYAGGEISVEDLIAQAEAETGLALPEDAETLAGESVALALSGDFDPEAFVNSADGSDLPIGVKIKGDPDEIETVLDKIRAQLGPAETMTLTSESDGDMVAVGPDSDYVTAILGGGDLGGSERFRDVVREAEKAGAIFFINFDAGDGWLVQAVEGDQEVAENLKPLEGLGMSAWHEGDAAHAVLRVTVN